MKNKKGKKNNFEKFQNATDKSKGVLKNTFENLFSFMENIFENSKIKIETNENMKCEENNTIDIIVSEEPNIQTECTYIQEHDDREILFKDTIEENLEEQKKEIDALKDEFNRVSVKNKRSTLITGIHNFLSKTINIEINSISLNNRTTEILCSTIILNNRLRGIRRIIRKENKNIEYINSSVEINNETLCIEKANELIQDSIQQIKNLKQEFIMEFYYDMDRYPETEDIMTEFSSIEYQITSKERELENKKDI